jgi:hypothetical protein
MRKVVLAAVAASLLVCGSVRESAALVCPVPQAGDAGGAIASGDALEDAAKRGAAIAALRSKGLSNGAIIDSLIAAYCPAVAGNNALSEAQKTAQVRSFASRITRAVYALDDVEAVIIDVPLPPNVAAAVNASAAAQNVSPETWVARVVTRAVKRAKRRR